MRTGNIFGEKYVLAALLKFIRHSKVFHFTVSSVLVIVVYRILREFLVQYPGNKENSDTGACINDASRRQTGL